MKKKLLTASVLVLCAVALVVGSVFATVAYLTASSGVSNVFTVGNVGITMYETKVNPDGTAVNPAATTDTNSYHLVPDTTYIKDPTIQITSLLKNDEMYLFVKSSNQIRKAEAGNAAGATEQTPKTMRQQMHDNGWVEFVRSQDGVEIVWVYGTRDEATGVIIPTAVNPTSQQFENADAGKFVLCKTFTIAKDAKVDLYGAASVNFTAFAIQTSGVTFEDNTQNNTVKTAWEAVKATYPYACGIVNPVNPYDGTQDPYAPILGVEKPEEIPLA